MGIFRKKKPIAPQKTAFAPRQPRSRPLSGLLLLGLGALYAVAMVDFKPGQSRQVRAAETIEHNAAGMFGAELSWWSLNIFGAAAWLLPLIILILACMLLFRCAQRVRGRLLVALAVFVVAASGMAALIESRDAGDDRNAAAVDGVTVVTGGALPETSNFYPRGYGGLAGKVFYNNWSIDYLGSFGTALLVVFAFAGSLAFIFTENFSHSFAEFRRYWAERQRMLREQRQRQREEKARLKADAKTARLEAKKAAKPPASASGPLPVMDKSEKLSLGREGRVEPVEAEPEETEETDDAGETPLPVQASPKGSASRLFTLSRKSRAEEGKTAAGGKNADIKLGKGETRSGLTIHHSEKTEKAEIKRPERKGDHVFPPLDYLADAASDNASGVEEPAEDYQKTANLLVQILEEFNVKVRPSEVQTGPVITRYEVKPAAGVRVEKILSLDKNIALGLHATAVRIIAPVPGKGTVGIEVPNRKPMPVCMREIIESRAWNESQAEIPVVLGKDVTGKPIVEDLTKMPHMLIAGSTGSGKTVCINTIITSLLYHAAPEDLRFLMVDPKVVEMQVFNQLPHMLIPVVTEPKKVPAALKYLIKEMERRYQIFAKVGVRNIAGFNRKLAKDREEQDRAAELEKDLNSAISPEERVAASSIEVPRDPEFEIPETKLPYIVCIIDELADLMMVAPQDIETGVARLAQLARAAGIHLILATQRPSVNVITGVIKANLPTRISFKVATKVDSRTILDQGGAEALIGKGDMLFVPPGTSHLVRAQGAFVADEEINSIVAFLKEQNGEPNFDETVQAQLDSDEEGESGAAAGTYSDDMVPDAIAVLKASKRASTSMLQRRLKIGYNRAARIMEILEDEGIVGPENGSSPREILRDLDTL